MPRTATDLPAQRSLSAPNLLPEKASAQARVLPKKTDRFVPPEDSSYKFKFQTSKIIQKIQEFIKRPFDFDDLKESNFTIDIPLEPGTYEIPTHTDYPALVVIKEATTLNISIETDELDEKCFIKKASISFDKPIELTNPASAFSSETNKFWKAVNWVKDRFATLSLSCLCVNPENGDIIPEGKVKIKCWWDKNLADVVKPEMLPGVRVDVTQIRDKRNPFFLRPIHLDPAQHESPKARNEALNLSFYEKHLKNIFKKSKFSLKGRVNPSKEPLDGKIGIPKGQELKIDVSGSVAPEKKGLKVEVKNTSAPTVESGLNKAFISTEIMLKTDKTLSGSITVSADSKKEAGTADSKGHMAHEAKLDLNTEVHASMESFELRAGTMKLHVYSKPDGKTTLERKAGGVAYNEGEAHIDAMLPYQVGSKAEFEELEVTTDASATFTLKNGILLSQEGKVEVEANSKGIRIAVPSFGNIRLAAQNIHSSAVNIDVHADSNEAHVFSRRDLSIEANTVESVPA